MIALHKFGIPTVANPATRKKQTRSPVPQQPRRLRSRDSLRRRKKIKLGVLQVQGSRMESLPGGQAGERQVYTIGKA